MNRFFVGKVVGNVLFGILCVVLAAFAFNCAAVKTAVHSVDDEAAQLLCAQSKAELQGISVEQARDAYCSTRDTWRPWLDAVLKARRMGAALAAGTTPPGAGPNCPPDAPSAATPAPTPSGTKAPPAGSPGAP